MCGNGMSIFADMYAKVGFGNYTMDFKKFNSR